MDVLPNEVLEKIFEYLDPQSLMACRVVCCLWLKIVKNILKKDIIWCKHCESGYSDIWQSAKIKSKSELSLYQLYKSLSLWRRLSKAIEIRIEFSIAIDYAQSVQTFQILRNEVIGVLKMKSIVYYDANTLQPLHDLTIDNTEQYFDYKENDDVILLHTFSRQLIIRRKSTRNIIETRIPDVKLFLILGNVIYFVRYTPLSLYSCVYDPTQDCFISSYKAPLHNGVLTLGHKNGILHLLSETFDLYRLSNDVLIFINRCDSTRAKFEILTKYDFANNVNWANCCTCAAFFGSMKSEYPAIKDLQSVRIHGPVLFAIYEKCIVRVFYSIYNTGLLDLLHTSPIKVLTEPQDQLEVTINNIDVIEGEESHAIIIGKNTKIHAIKFNHSELRSSSSSSPSSSHSISSDSGGEEPTV